MKRAIWWIRRDLRLGDNQALHAAMKNADQILPVFILDPLLLNSPYVGEKRKAFLFDGLRRLDHDLRTRGSRLFVREGDPKQVLSKLRDRFDVQWIFAEQDFSSYATRRDQLVADHLPMELLGGVTLRHPAGIRKPNGDPYLVYSPYRRAWKALPLPQPSDLLVAPDHITTPEDPRPTIIPSQPKQPEDAAHPAGEAEAIHRLKEFTEKPNSPIHAYDQQRDYLGRSGTSQLSAYLRFGMLSVRQAVVAAGGALQENKMDSGAGADSWLNELIWRDFFFAILFHFPEVRRMSFRPDLRVIRWINNEEDFDAWRQGLTGYPLVDAAMRQLDETGWMHNRARMIAASFLVKDLLIDWRWGEKWFMQHLIDGDPSANNGGWQWSAGTGTDAAPYFRVFNPVLQSRKFDPQGEYIRRWVPELARVRDDYIHEPWKMPVDAQESSGCQIGSDYPDPIVDHSWARQRALNAYRRSRDRANKPPSKKSTVRGDP